MGNGEDFTMRNFSSPVYIYSMSSEPNMDIKRKQLTQRAGSTIASNVNSTKDQAPQLGLFCVQNIPAFHCHLQIVNGSIRVLM